MLYSFMVRRLFWSARRASQQKPWWRVKFVEHELTDTIMPKRDLLPIVSFSFELRFVLRCYLATD